MVRAEVSGGGRGSSIGAEVDRQLEPAFGGAVPAYVDLEPQFHLRAVEPVREEGKVTGYLTAFYNLSAAAGGGVQVSAGGAETNIGGRIERGQAPDSEVLHLPSGATYLRLFFRSWSVSQDRRIALIAAGSAGAREKASAEFEGDPEGFCSGARTRGAAGEAGTGGV